MTQTIDQATIVDRYFSAWNERDALARAEAVANAFTDDARYCDPLADVTGHAAIASMMGALQDQHAGLSLRVSSAIDAHHDLLRFGWEAVDAEGNVTVAGIDIAKVSDDGRVRSLHGFFGETPPAAV